MMQWSFGNACLRNLTPYFADRRFFAIDVDSHLLMASEYVFFFVFAEERTLRAVARIMSRVEKYT